MTHWVQQAVFYHIYPFGFCGAPDHNDFHSSPIARLDKVREWLPHIKDLGVNALYLGPIFESTSHGYDTIDYFRVDRRLGDHRAMKLLAEAVHSYGMRLVLDAVFNHVGRDFWAFLDVRGNLGGSPYVGWFDGLRFDRRNTYGDPFSYRGWNSHENLVKLDLGNPAVREHLFSAVDMWIREYDLDGLRLDAAECMHPGFLQALRSFCKGVRPDFWLMGEVVGGDYRRWANQTTLDSVTNYECYKGLWSSLVDANYFEIAYSLERQFGLDGLYRDLTLYNFADNHDVDRVASSLTRPEHLIPLYCLLFTIPGVPSIYYGSEWGVTGKKTGDSDAALRPCLDLGRMPEACPLPELAPLIARLSAVRRSSPALMAGEYFELAVAHQQLAFCRRAPEEGVVVLLNAGATPASFDLDVPSGCGAALFDRLNPGDHFDLAGNRLRVAHVPAFGCRILSSAAFVPGTR